MIKGAVSVSVLTSGQRRHKSAEEIERDRLKQEEENRRRREKWQREKNEFRKDIGKILSALINLDRGDLIFKIYEFVMKVYTIDVFMCFRG